MYIEKSKNFIFKKVHTPRKTYGQSDIFSLASSLHRFKNQRNRALRYQKLRHILLVTIVVIIMIIIITFI